MFSVDFVVSRETRQCNIPTVYFCYTFSLVRRRRLSTLRGAIYILFPTTLSKTTFPHIIRGFFIFSRNPAEKKKIKWIGSVY